MTQSVTSVFAEKHSLDKLNLLLVPLIYVPSNLSLFYDTSSQFFYAKSWAFLPCHSDNVNAIDFNNKT